MRIAIPIHAFEPGGVERVGLRLAESWQAAGHDVVVVLGRDRGACREERPDLAYRGYREPFPTGGWETIWMMISLTRFLLRERVDVIFCPGLTYTAACVVARLLLGKRCPPVLVKVSNDLDRPDIAGVLRWPYRLWLRVQGRLLDRFVAIGAPMRGEIARDLQIATNRVGVIPDPALTQADLARLDPATRSEGTGHGRHFLAVGRLASQKNFPLLLEAFALLAGRGDQLVIAGEGPARDALQAQANRLGLADRIHMPGHVQDTPALYRAADVLVLSSDFEGVPAVVIEALAAGLPIATTDCCASMGWLLDDGRFGCLAPKGDAAGLARAMAAAAQINPPRQDMRRFASGFTIDRASADYLAQLGQLARCQMHEFAEKSQVEVRVGRGGGV